MSIDGNDVPVDIDGTSHLRVVYGKMELFDRRIQVGYVQIDFLYIPVWRPFEPEDKDYFAAWRKGIWRNLHRLRMKQAVREGKVRLTLEPHIVGEKVVSLPGATMQLDPQLIEHLAKLDMIS